MLEPGFGLLRMLIAEDEVADHGQAGILAGEVAGPRRVRLQHAGADRIERLEHAGHRAGGERLDLRAGRWCCLDALAEVLEAPCR